MQIGAAAGIRDVADDARCTVCHAPFAGVPTAQRIGPLDRGDGVSCETCHGPAEPWIRAHTRTAKDGYTHSDKVAAGLRDLRNPYVRANTCVACHGTDGIGITPQYPTLAGQHADYLERALTHYKKGGRQNAIMSGFAGQLSARDIKSIAAYYAAQRPSLDAVKPPTRR